MGQDGGHHENSRPVPWINLTDYNLQQYFNEFWALNVKTIISNEWMTELVLPLVHFWVSFALLWMPILRTTFSTASFRQRRGGTEMVTLPLLHYTRPHSREKSLMPIASKSKYNLL